VRTVLARLRYVYGRIDECRAELERARSLEGEEPDATVRAWITEGQMALFEREGRYAEEIIEAREAQRSSWFPSASRRSHRDILSRLQVPLMMLARYTEALQTVERTQEACGESPSCLAVRDYDRASVLRKMARAGLVANEEVAAAFEGSYASASKTSLSV